MSKKEPTALESEIDQAEVLLMLRETAEGVHLAVMPRDEEPNQESLAIVLAAFINANLPALTKAAVQAKLHHETPMSIAQRQPRSITTTSGDLAKKTAAIVGLDGKPIH